MQNCSNIKHVSGPAEEEKEGAGCRMQSCSNIQHVSGPAEEEKEGQDAGCRALLKYSMFQVLQRRRRRGRMQDAEL
jgi:hypothetical protein